VSVEHAAQLLAAGDPQRARCVMAAPVAARPTLVALHALNLEIGRAAWASPEPMLAEMRLQWWRDGVAEIVAGGTARAHPVLLAARDLLAGDPEAGALWDRLIEARRWDVWADPFADRAALWAHVQATAGGLAWAVARALGASRPAETVVRDAAAAGGIADWLAAAPRLRALGRHPLPDPSAEALGALAAEGLARHAAARASRALLPASARPAIWPHAGAATRLRWCLANPRRALAGLPDAPRHALLLAALLNRW
jgi:phytoene synthase